MACWKIGAVVVPVSVRYSESKINSVLANIRCEKIFVSSNYNETKLVAKKYLMNDLREKLANSDKSYIAIYASECRTMKEINN